MNCHQVSSLQSMNPKQTNTKFKTVLCLVAPLICAQILADEETHFPGASSDRGTIKAQELVEELYVKGEYERSLLIYERELAPTGDKYAQYMVGFMHLTGQGTDVDRSTALAWYRLAAERQDVPIVQARDALYQAMSQEEIVRSNQLFVDIWRKFGDNPLLLRLIRDDLRILKERTGSRIGGGNGSSPLTIISSSTGTSSSDAYYERVRQRIARRLEFLKSNVEIIDLELGDELAVKGQLEEEIREAVFALDI